METDAGITHVGDSSFVELSNAFDTAFAALLRFHEANVVKPGVIVVRLFGNLVLVLELLLAHDDVFNSHTVTELFLMDRISLVDLFAVLFRKVVECVFVDNPRSLMLWKGANR